MDLVFGYLAGLLTLINPCVLPVLPLVLGAAIQSHRLGPLALAAGLSVSFVALGLGVATIGKSLGIREETVAQAGAVLMILFGLALVIPQVSARFATATGTLSNSADSTFERLDRGGLPGQFLGGMLLGAVWSPCIGPTLGAAISLAWSGESLAFAGAIMASFALGVSTIILALGYGARAAIQRRQAAMRALMPYARPILGGLFIAVGLAILFKLHHLVEIWAIQTLPAWLIDLSVSL